MVQQLFLFLLLSGIFFISCKKEFSCENFREQNKRPIANAGGDTTIMLPNRTNGAWAKSIIVAPR